MFVIYRVDLNLKGKTHYVFQKEFEDLQEAREYLAKKYQEEPEKPFTLVQE